VIEFTSLVETLTEIGFGGQLFDNVDRVGILFDVTANGEAKLGIGFVAMTNN
jgi:hypothetical protein